MRLKKILQEIVNDYDDKRYDEEGERKDNFDLQEWLDSWMATLEIMLDRKTWRGLKRGMRDIRKGKVTKFIPLEEI